MSKLKETKEQRAAEYAKAAELLKQEQTPEVRTKVDAMLATVETLSQDIARIERADKIAAEIAASQPVDGGVQAPTEADQKAAAAKYRSAWKQAIERGVRGQCDVRALLKGGVSQENRTMLDDVQVRMQGADMEKREQLAGQQSIAYSEGTPGGYFVPAGFVYDVEKATKFYANLLDGQTVKILETATGAILPYPTSNDTNQAWHVLGEAAQIQQNNGGGSARTANYATPGTLPTTDAGDVLVGHVNFGAWKGSTGIVRVSLELLQDSAFNIEAFLTDAFAVRLGRGYEVYLTQGTGANQPFGILPAIAASGAVAVTAIGSAQNDGLSDGSNTSANSIGYFDIVNLIHSVDPTYRRNAKFMLHDQTLAHLKTRLDKFGRPLWVPSVRENEPDRIAGYQYVINQSMPLITGGATSLAFGAWEKFIVRKVRDLQVLRLDERFADQGEVAYLAFSRIDSNLVDAGTHPLNVLVQHT